MGLLKLPGVKLPATVTTETEGIFALKTKPAATPYYPPAPPAGTGFHRYGKYEKQIYVQRVDIKIWLFLVFLLLQEPIEGATIPSGAVEHKSDPKSRAKWNAMAFAEKYNLKLVGANYFLTQEGQA